MVLQFVGEYVVAFFREPQLKSWDFCFNRCDAVGQSPQVVAFLVESLSEKTGFLVFKRYDAVRPSGSVRRLF